MAKPNKDLNPQLQQSKPPQVDEVAKQSKGQRSRRWPAGTKMTARTITKEIGGNLVAIGKTEIGKD